MSHVETVRAIYAAFGQKDVPAILERLAPDVEWEYGGGTEGVAWLSTRRGRAGVVEFFQSLAGLQLSKFDVHTVLGEGRLVVALIAVEAVAVATGKRISEQDEVHLWHFDERGQVQRFRHAVDTLQHWRACLP